MLRQIIKIDEDLCNGCGACVSACHEGAIELQNGIAKLVRDDYCDGLGNCLPACPTGAIKFEQREAAAFDEAAVEAKMKAQADAAPESKPFMGCPGTASRQIQRPIDPVAVQQNVSVPDSQLRQWPIQIQLVPVNAPYFENANLLVAADCAAFAYGDFHNKFIKNHITIIGCPKLDDVDYSDKLTAIIKNNNLKSITVVRMEVPCCGGIAHAVTEAIRNSGKMIPWQIVTIGTDGTILE
ncbi:MAG: 4Fe-4S binding protein [Clostridia bacterium]